MMSTDSNFRILVADDDAVSRRLLVTTLHGAGYKVLEVDDGRMALQSLSSADGPRLALIDWVMPKLDGPAVCRGVRKKREKPYVHIILLTSKASPHDIVAGLEAGADDYLVKPVHSEELKARLRRGQRIIQLEDELLHNALHDPLTRLPNRALFLDRLGTCLRQAKTCPGYKFAVLFVDLDGFKIVNDSLGHHAGDQLIVAVSRRLANCLRRIDLISRPCPPMGVTVSGSEDTVARLGGDEFTILLEGISSSSDSLRVAERIQQQFAAPFFVNGQELFSTASIGIALSETGYESPDEMLRDADTSMYRAKALGKAQCQVFDPEMHASVVSRLRLETEVRRALEREEFRIHYQPVVSLADCAIVGFEALIRWDHPDKGLRRPSEFLTVAEDTGLIVPLGRWVLRQACRQMQAWNLSFRPHQPFHVAVNLSAKEFADPALVHVLTDTLSETGLPPHALTLELTESLAMRDADKSLRTFNEIHALGVRLSIDDFGTGYSSLSHLRHFPLQTIKIDRSFITDLAGNRESWGIVQAIMTLAHNLAMEVIAEGIEIPQQAEELRSLACEYAQGYLFSAPLAGDVITLKLEAGWAKVDLTKSQSARRSVHEVPGEAAFANSIGRGQCGESGARYPTARKGRTQGGGGG